MARQQNARARDAKLRPSAIEKWAAGLKVSKRVRDEILTLGEGLRRYCIEPIERSRRLMRTEKRLRGEADEVATWPGLQKAAADIRDAANSVLHALRERSGPRTMMATLGINLRKTHWTDLLEVVCLPNQNQVRARACSAYLRMCHVLHQHGLSERKADRAARKWLREAGLPEETDPERLPRELLHTLTPGGRPAKGPHHDERKLLDWWRNTLAPIFSKMKLHHGKHRAAVRWARELAALASHRKEFPSSPECQSRIRKAVKRRFDMRFRYFTLVALALDLAAAERGRAVKTVRRWEQTR